LILHGPHRKQKRGDIVTQTAEKERERERIRKKWGSSERHYIWGGGVRKKESIFPVWKVPRQCPLVLLVEASYIIRIIFIIIISFNVTAEGLHYGEI
jgi:hypothetical protein